MDDEELFKILLDRLTLVEVRNDKLLKQLEDQERSIELLGATIQSLRAENRALKAEKKAEPTDRQQRAEKLWHEMHKEYNHFEFEATDKLLITMLNEIADDCKYAGYAARIRRWVSVLEGD